MPSRAVLLAEDETTLRFLYHLDDRLGKTLLPLSTDSATVSHGKITTQT
jgi:hypothetical protein